MLTKRRWTPVRTAAAAATSLVVASTGLVAAVTPVAAEPSPRCGLTDCDHENEPEADPDAGDGAVSIRVWGSATTEGEDGYDIPAETVVVLPPCRYFRTTWSGKDYYEGIEDGSIGQYDRDYEPYPNYEKYKDDTEGRWWAGVCDSGDFDGDIEDFSEYAEEWFENEYEPIYVEVTDPPPVPPIPPEVLVQVAYDEMTLPDPEIGWNPKRDGDAATFVNVDTWLWLDEGPTQLEVFAEAGDNRARVESTLGSLNFSAPNAAPVSCDGTGTEWSPGAGSTECALVFERSSANQPGEVSRVTAESQWDIEWFANGAPQGALDPQTTSATFDLPVAEAQTVVTD